MAPQSVFIQQFQHGRCEKRLTIRVSRMWRSYNTKKARELMSLDFLAIDEKTGAIQCCVRSKFIPDFEGLFAEGSFYRIKNFTLDFAKPLYRVVQRDLLILLDASTYVEEIIKDQPVIPRHMFQIVPYNNLLTVSNDKKNLCDVIGYVVGVSEPGERMANFQIVSMQYIDIEDTSGNKLRITRWGDEIIKRAHSVCTAAQRTWIICSVIAKIDSNGNLSVPSSSATCFSNKTTISEIQQFLTMLGPREDDGGIGNIAMHSTSITKEEYDRNKMLIPDVNNLLLNCKKMKNPLYVYASLTKIEEINGWKYNFCRACKKKVHLKKGKLHCYGCQKDELYPLIRYRVEADLHDRKDSLKCVLFDREIEKLICIKAVDLAQIVYEGYGEPLPRQLCQLIRKCYVFQLELNEKRIGTTVETFTVKRVFLEGDIRERSHDKVESRSGTSSFSIETPYMNEKRSNLRIRSDDDTMGGLEHELKVQTGKGKEITGSKKARKALQLK